MRTLLSRLFAPRPIWKETSREFLRRKMEPCCLGGIVEVDTFDYYAVTYTDIHSGKTKTVEESVLVF